MPTAWRLFGNRNLAAHYRGEARRLLFLLQERTGLLGLDQDQIIRTYPDGTTIQIATIFGQETVNIISPFIGAKAERIIREILVFLYALPVINSQGKTIPDQMFYVVNFPKGDRPGSLVKVDPPKDFGHSDENSNSNLGALAYVINKLGRKNHIITIGTPYENWDLVQDNTDEGLGKFPITVLFNVPSACTHAHIRGGSEAAKWGTCGYPEDAIIPPEHSMSWPFRSILPFSYVAKKRTMNPIYGFWIPIRVDDDIVWQEDPQYTGSDWGVSGKRNFKLSDDGKEAVSWRDTLQVSGVGTIVSDGAFTEDGSPAGGLLVVTYGWYPFPSPAFCWKPWYAWLHEVVTFDYFDADSYKSAVDNIANAWDLQPRSPYKYQRKYKTASGELIQNDIFTEILNHNYNPVFSVNSADSGTDGRCDTGQEGESHSYSVSAGGYGGSSSGTLYTPIASLGDGKYLYIENTFAAGMGHDGNEKDGTLHQDDFPCGYTICNQNFQLDCACNDQYFDPLAPPGWSHHDLRSEDWDGVWGQHDTTNNVGLTQTLVCGDSEIEEFASTMEYNLSIYTYAGSYEWYFAHADPEVIPGGIACPPVVDSQGSQNQNERIDSEGWTRTQEFVEVLDYDNIGTDTAIVIYKKVSILHTATFAYHGFGVDVSVDNFPYTAESTKGHEWSGTRTVTYWVWVKIGDHIEKFQIPQTFIGSCAGKYGTFDNEEIFEESQTGAGQRIFGVSCQINDDLIVYSYAVEDFATVPSTGYDYYSSPLNWEDRDRQGLAMSGNPAWTKNKMVLGAIRIKDYERAAFDVPDDFTDRKVYSVGMHESERVEVQI